MASDRQIQCRLRGKPSHSSNDGVAAGSRRKRPATGAKPDPGFDPKPSLTGTEQPRGQIEFSLTWLLCMPQATHHLGAANYAVVGQALLGVDMRATPLLSRGDSSSGGSQ